MRKALLALILAITAGALAAQATQGISITSVIHEPTADDVGEYIRTIQVPNPYYSAINDPDNNGIDNVNGQPRFLTAYGNGRGYADELDSISTKFNAIGGTTTHDLAIMTNNSGADIIIDASQGNIPVVSSIRPAKDVPLAPETPNPGYFTQEIIPFDNGAVSVPNGSTVAVWLLVTKWFDRLDTSPRDYIITFGFTDLSPGGGTKTVEAPLVIPEVGGDVGGGGCVTKDSGVPYGVSLGFMTALVAIVTRRKLLERAK